MHLSEKDVYNAFFSERRHDSVTVRRDPVIAEFFCGIGGLSACLRPHARVLAVDINLKALHVYGLNFQHPTLCLSIESLPAELLQSWDASCWWMSAPCQPYTQRGRGLDTKDRRAAALLHLIDLIPRHRPAEIALENVPEFRGSRSHDRLCKTLEASKYHFQEIELCPTQFGFDNRRRRYFLIAGQERRRPWSDLEVEPRPPTMIQHSADLNQLVVSESLLAQYRTAMHLVSAGAPHEVTSCFTSAYGRSHIRSGSYLRLDDVGMTRRFSPLEILWQLGFASEFRLPDWPYSKLWPLVGNSLSLPCVGYVLGHLPIFAGCLRESGVTSPGQ